MRNLTRLVWSLVFLCLAVGGVGYGETIIVRADAWPPFNDDPASSQPGYAVEVLKAIYEPLGYTIDYQTQPWNRAIADCLEGKADAIIGASPSDGAGCLFPTEPMGMQENEYYVMKGQAWTYQGPESLKQIRIGVADGYSYDDGGPLDEYIKNGQPPAVQAVTGDTPLQSNIQKLQAGRIDALIECQAVMAWTLKSMGLTGGEIVGAGSACPPSALYIGFSPTKEPGKNLVPAFDEGLRKLRASGELKTILAKYDVTDWK